MFSAVFVNGGISKSSIIKSMFWAAVINHSHISVLTPINGTAGARDGPGVEGSSEWRWSLRFLWWRMQSSPGDCGDFVVFFSSIRSQLKPARLGCLWLQLLWRSWWPVNYRSCYSYSSVQLWKTYFPLFLLFLRFKSPASVSFIKRPLAPGKL